MAYDVKIAKEDWLTLDPEALSTASGKAYETYKRLYREMKAARETFERTMLQEARADADNPLPMTEKLVFGYNFGKLSMARAPNDKPETKAAKGKLSMSAWLAIQREHGART